MTKHVISTYIFCFVQTYFLGKYKEAKCEDAWDEIGKHLPTVSGLPGALPKVWWKKGVYLTPERVDSYVAHLSLPFVGKDGRQKRRVSEPRDGLRGALSVLLIQS
jgi:hypothetical protein